ncbi:MAG: hypothetical protein ISQ21_02520 [Alphaproteobacteria bacterium]|nr:hypothetical protein [Alphaproteobacteria bacterium]
MKPLIKRLSRPLLAMSLFTGIIGCTAFEPEYGECPPILAAEGAEEQYLYGTKLGQLIKVRFNGIVGQCVPRDGYTDMRLFINLLLRRDMTTGSNIERTEIHITAAIIDADDNVVSREVFTDDGSFRDGMDISMPEWKERLDVPYGHKVVLALGRVAE